MATFIVLGSSHPAYFHKRANKNDRAPNWYLPKLLSAKGMIRVSKSVLIFPKVATTYHQYGILLTHAENQQSFWVLPIFTFSDGTF